MNYEIAHEITHEPDLRCDMRCELDENQIKLKSGQRTDQLERNQLNNQTEPDSRLTDRLDELLGFGEVVHELKEINIFFTIEGCTRNKVFQP